MKAADTKRLGIRYVSGVCLCAAFMLFSFTSFSSPAFADPQQTENRIRHLERQLQTLSRAVYRGETPPAGALDTGAGDSSTMAHIELRLSYMEEELRNLTGQMEEYGHEISRLNRRVEELEGALGAMTVAAPPSTRPPEPETRPGAPGGTTVFLPPAGEETRPDRGAPDRRVIDDLPDGVQKLGVLRVPEEGAPPRDAPEDTPEKAYERAFSFIRDSKYEDAATAFSAFLQRYGDHALAANAQYWLAETYYVRGEFAQAARLFAQGYQKFPEGSKTADNLLKLGLSLARDNKKDEACLALAQLQSEFPDQAGPVLERGRQEQKRLECP
ncbi:MAG: tol-pal system protein YbgF [Micavibrio sp.]|nr:MAG: tol-pal system protein YbgF [Micavibrio sp.]